LITPVTTKIIPSNALWRFHHLSNIRLKQYFQSFWDTLRHLIAQQGARLVLLLISIFLPLRIFGKLAEEVWENDGGFSWDQPILLAVHQIATPQLDQFAKFITKFGVFWGVFPVAIAIALWLLAKQSWHRLAYLLITLLGSIVINRTTKALLHRVRPQLWLSPAPEADYGFPSGHAMSSMTLVVALVILTWHTRWCGWVLILGSLFVMAIGWTRLYLGVHYPSDVLAGWAASIAWAIGVALVIRPQWEAKSQKEQT
jgi:membrane-associated phospholipid phosphatase